IPTGTGNVFARELEYSFAPFTLARTLQAGPVERIPLGEVNGEPFLSVVGVGLDAEAVRHFEAVNPRFLGRASFVYPVLRALAGRPSRPLVVATESGRHRAHWVIVSRVKRYAGDLLLTPEAGLAKPGMHVIRFEGAGRMKRLRQLSALVTGLLPHDPHVSIEAAQRVTITGNQNCPVQIDGEFKGALPLEISLHPERLGVIMPAEVT
ncbi:MAG: diacylglycerol/lipid kinase family protein, partial [Methyloligellaceae bacterium]